MSTAPLLIILAGGASSRLWPLEEKSLVRFGQLPLLTSQLQTYQSLGFQECIIVANPKNQAAIEAIAAESTIPTQVVIQSEPNGMGDAILQTEPVLKDRLDEGVYITQAHDVVEDQLHSSMLKMYRSNPKSTYIAGVEMDDYFPGGYLIVDETGLISGIVEKPEPEKRPSKYVNIVAHLHANAGDLFEAIRAEYASDNSADDHYERAMDTLMKKTPYHLVGYKGRWDALKYPWHVLGIMESFLDRITGQEISPDAYIADTAKVIGNVIIEAGAKLFPGSAVVGPAYIGKNTILGNNSLVRNSMVLDHCDVGFTTEVARSYVASGCAMHACRVLDSVFAENVNFSAGCTTANLRMDRGIVKSTVKEKRLLTGRDKLGAMVGRDAFLSVDVMTMPGIKVGRNAKVGPGTHVLKDVADGVKVYVKQEQIIIEPEGE